MKKLKILFGTVILSAGLASCSSAYYASAGYASDDLYAVHDRAEISRRKQAEAEAQRAAAEARRAEWEARIAEAKAAAAENSYYEYRSADANPYESVLADDYESAYARRLRGFESPTYKMPSSYINARYGSAFNYVSAYDPAFYNIVVMGDQVWVEPKYITSMFGSWGTVIYSDPWYYGWNRPWGPSFSFGSWGWSFGWNSWHNPWYGPGWGPWYSSWYDPWYGPGWGWGPGWHGHHHGPGWGPGWHGRPYHSNIVRRPNPYTSPSGTRYGVGSRSGSKSTGSMRGGSSGGRNTFGVRDNMLYFDEENQRYLIDKHITDHSTRSTRNATHNDGYPERISQCNALPYTDHRKQCQTDTVEDEKRIMQVNEMLSEKNDPK